MGGHPENAHPGLPEGCGAEQQLGSRTRPLPLIPHCSPVGGATPAYLRTGETKAEHEKGAL